jgi:hypothetical protein
LLTIEARFRSLLEAYLDDLIEEKRNEVERGLADRDYWIAVGYLRCLRVLADTEGPLAQIERQILEG